MNSAQIDKVAIWVFIAGFVAMLIIILSWVS